MGKKTGKGGEKSRYVHKPGFCEYRAKCGNDGKKCGECSKIQGRYTHYFPREWK